MSFTTFTKELRGKRVEGELLKALSLTILVGAIMFYFAHMFFFSKSGKPFMVAEYYYVLALLSFVLLAPTIHQVRAYKQFNCMSGMMIGMTTGMIAGFLSGFYVGATNGMVTGGVFGMIVGMTLGIWMGKTCGVMGFLEGMMAGFMGGLMGAMTAIMLLIDHMDIMAGIVFVICGVILFALNYMIYLEMKENEREREQEFRTIIVLMFVLSLVTLLVMMYGPKSPLFA